MQCFLSICENWNHGNTCGCSESDKNLIGDVSTCPHFIRNLKSKNPINIISKNSFLFTALNVNNINYICQGDVFEVSNRLEYLEDGKIRLKK